MGDLTPGIAQSPPAGMPPFIYRLRVDAVSGDAALRVMWARARSMTDVGWSASIIARTPVGSPPVTAAMSASLSPARARTVSVRGAGWPLFSLRSLMRSASRARG